MRPMRNNWTIIAAAVLAIVTATLAIVFRPMTKTGEWEPMTTATSSRSKTYEIPTEREKLSAETTAGTTRVNSPSTTKRLTSESSAPSTTKRQSKIVSKLHEIAEKDREWLEEHEHTTQPSMTPAEFRKAGVIYANGYKYTYYSERVLPGPGLKIPGRHSDGNFVRDGDGYICVASCDLPKGTVVATPFGEGKVYDVCGESGTIDIYVSF